MILRFCVCIPTYNNPATIEAVVKDCLKQTPYPILVIDDGSTPLVNFAWRDERVQIVRLSSNRGKGLALQTAFDECLRRGFTHVISVDGDGQHLATEISKLTAVALNDLWCMVIGSRSSNPRMFLASASSGAISLTFGYAFRATAKSPTPKADSENLPLFHVQNLKFWTRKFDFEIEVLITGPASMCVKPGSYYPKREDRVSHFHKFWDNLRISLLNTVLVVVSLLRTHCEPKQIGLAVGTGVLVGCTPFFGFHTPIAAFLAFVFRFNAAYLWLGTQISIPPLAPFIALASMRLGSWLTGQSPEGAAAFSWNWLLGSLGVGAVLGLLAGLGSYAIARKVQLSRPPEHLPPLLVRARARLLRIGTAAPAVANSATGFLSSSPTPSAFVRHTLSRSCSFRIFIFLHRRRAAPRTNTRQSIQRRLLASAVAGPDSPLSIRANALGSHRRKLSIRHPRRISISNSELRHRKHHASRTPGTRSHPHDCACGQLGSGRRQYETPWTHSDFSHPWIQGPEGATFDKAVGDEGQPEHVQHLISNEVRQPLLHVRERLGLGQPVGLMGDRPARQSP